MNITEITNRAGAKKRRKRVGRGEGSGHGKTSCRGNKGGGQRQSWRQRLFHEGGAFPLFRRVAKRGFSNAEFGTDYQVVNVSALHEHFTDGAHVTAATLAEAGLITHATAPVKILGDGEFGKKLTVSAERFSGEAAKKIEAAGGKVERLGPQPKKKFIKRPPPPPAVPEAKDAKKGKGEGKAKGEGKPKGEGKGGGEGKKPKGEKPEKPAEGASE